MGDHHVWRFSRAMNWSWESACGTRNEPSATDVTLTVDTFIAEVRIDTHRSILVYLRQHGGRMYVRWRVFHKHRKHGKWYPHKRRAFVVPLGAADAVGRAIACAAGERPVTANLEWLAKIAAHRACCSQSCKI
jgi:hypothetical protein